MNEIIACPSCQRKVTVPRAFFGKQVQCPQCRHTFTAFDPALGAVQPGAPPTVKLAPEPLPAQRDSWDDAAPAYRVRQRSWDGGAGGIGYEDDDIALHRPLMPHRGVAVLTIGILGLTLICAPVFGPVAWMMGSADLKQMRAGQMDRSGEGMTQAGMILGIVMTVFAAAALAMMCMTSMAHGNGMP